VTDAVAKPASTGGQGFRSRNWASRLLQYVLLQALIVIVCVFALHQPLSEPPSRYLVTAFTLEDRGATRPVIIAGNGVRVGYVHVWSYAGGAYQRALEDLIADGPLRDADALVWDLRDGWGGAEPQYLDLFNPNAPTMQVTDRDGHTRMQDVKWR